MSAPLRIRIKIAPRSRARAQRWGDWYFAAALAEALRAGGAAAEVETREDWAREGRPGDVALHLRGWGGWRPEPGRPALLWLVSHPGRATAEELDAYDHVFVASDLHAAELAPRLGARVSPLLQATDPAVMRPGPDAIESGLLFVGNNRRGGRPALALAIAERFAPSVWGWGWRGLAEVAPLLRGDHAPNAELGRRYAGAWAVLSDTWRDMRRLGYLPNRVFDVLASGAPLVTDAVAAIPDELRPWLHVWRRPREFRAVVEAALAEGESRRDARRAFANEVAARHCFAVRAAEIAAKARAILG